VGFGAAADFAAGGLGFVSGEVCEEAGFCCASASRQGSSKNDPTCRIRERFGIFCRDRIVAPGAAG
jgi:hypothetical protein